MIICNESVTLVPCLNQYMWASKEGSSSICREEVSDVNLSLLIDLYHASIDWKKEILLAQLMKC